MSTEQNPTEKGKPAENETVEIPVVVPICPHCGRALPGMNICEIILPTAQGGMTWLTACCPFMDRGDGLAKDGESACGKVIASQFIGYKPPTVARPGWVG